MKIKNNHGTALALPDGTVIPANDSATVDGWDHVKKNAVVKEWLARGVLAEGEKSAADGNADADAEKAEREALFAALEGAGVKFDKRTGTDKLKALLAQHQKPAAGGNADSED